LTIWETNNAKPDRSQSNAAVLKKQIIAIGKFYLRFLQMQKGGVSGCEAGRKEKNRR
jgi:hypothetical protein